MDVGGSNRRGNSGPRPPRSKSGNASVRATSSGSGPRVINGKSDKFAFTFPSNYDQGHTVQKTILASAEQHGFAGDSFFALRIALEEALVNAIKHGNRLDPQKKVHVEARVTAKRAEITVEDEGPGFNRRDVPDPTLGDNLHKCSGRGILLIEAYMNEVTWDRGGRRLRMVKENE
jgi:serine/threonine-protein kinase RsbW